MENSFGENVKKYRIQLGLTQDELAKLAGFNSRQQICQIEKGVVNPSIESARKLSAALRVQPNQLVDLSNIKNSIYSFYEYLPYLQNAEDWQLKAVREILKMPALAQKNGNSSTMAG